jgi:AcrR family transcriptional regulator
MTENATRGEARETAILRAAFELVAEIGYERLTMDAVAIRARASKATIYRRWPGKAELIAAALRLYAGNDTMHIAESDSLRGDLIALLRALRDKFERSDRALFSGVIRAMQCDAELAAIMRGQIARNKATVGELIGRRARDRGEPIPDLEIIREIGPAQLIIRLLITGEPVDDDYVTELVEEIMLPLLTRKVLAST